MRIILKAMLIGLAMLVVASGPAPAQNYPEKPVTFIVPWPPGGLGDLTGRPLAAALEHVWKTPMIIANRPGASGSVGYSAGSNAKPDGYTLLFANNGFVGTPISEKFLKRRPSFDTSKLVPIARIVADPQIICVRADSPWKTFEDLLAAARKNPGQIAYSSSGYYGPAHLPAEMLAHAAGVKFKHVPHTGGGPQVTSLLGGHVHFSPITPPGCTSHIKSGQMRGLVSTGATRNPQLPDVPSVYELGYKDAEFYIWIGLFGQADIPGPVMDRIRAGVAEAIKDPELLKVLRNFGSGLNYLNAPDFKDFLTREHQTIEATIQRIGMVGVK